MLEYAVVFHRAGWADTLPKNTIDEIFVVPVYSLFATSPAAYLDFLHRVGALDRAAEIVRAANLRRPEAAETARREVRAILTAAEVDLLLPPLPAIDIPDP
jgi:hypothetical protein